MALPSRSQPVGRSSLWPLVALVGMLVAAWLVAVALIVAELA
ncbi:MAG: hypothetical protein U0R69_00705 [Gaiellales bacterium]